MVAAYPTTGGYGTAALSNDGTGAALVDVLDGLPIVSPALNAATGNLSAAIINPVVPTNNGLPELNAILIELRVISELLQFQLGDRAPDVEQLRAGLLWDTTIGSGVV